MPSKVTDLELLNQLNASSDQKVTDPELLRQLGGELTPSPEGYIPHRGMPNLGLAAKNFIPSTLETVGGMAKGLVLEPVSQSISQGSLAPIARTAENVAIGGVSMGVGAVEKLIQKYGGSTGNKFLDWFGRGAMKNFWQPFEDQLVQKYGSLENLNKTIETRPAEVLMDLSTILAAGGKAAQMAGNPRAAQILYSTSSTVNPITALGKTAKAAGKVIPEGASRHIYESGAKWGTTLKPEVRRELTNTMLKEKIPLNIRGYDKLMDTVNDINQEIKAGIRPFANHPIDAQKVANYANDLKTKKFKNTFSPTDDAAAIDRVRDKFLADWGGTWGKPTGRPLTVEAAQEIKQDIYRQLKTNYDAVQKGGIGKYTDPEIAAMKQIARGLKEGIEAAVPSRDLKALNARESALLNAEPHLRRSVNRIGNWNILSLDDVLAGAGGAVIAGPTGGALASTAKHVLGRPTIKSKVAMGMEKWRQSKPNYLMPSRLSDTLDYLYQISQEQNGQPK